MSATPSRPAGTGLPIGNARGAQAAADRAAVVTEWQPRSRLARRAASHAKVDALGTGRARLVSGSLALGAAGAVGAYAIGLDGRYGVASETLVAVAIAFIVVGLLLRWSALVPWAVVALGSAYVLGRSGHETVDGWAAVVGTGLLATAELATWSIEHDARIHEEPRVQRARMSAFAAVACGALLLDVLIVAAAAVSGSSGLPVAAVGVAAAVTAVAVVVRLVRTA